MNLFKKKENSFRVFPVTVITRNFFYPAIKAMSPPMSITKIATYNSHSANAGNSSKIIRKIIASPTKDPPLAWFASTNFSPPSYLIILLYLILYDYMALRFDKVYD